jgi:phosphate:Na+ symporter
MLGAEIGTCADTLLASIGRSPQAVRTGLFHLCFNVFIVTRGVLFVTPWIARLFERIVPEKSEAGAPARRPAYST